MANQYKNKVVYGGVTIIDLTSDTVTADTLLVGITAHDASGTPLVGTASGGVWTSGIYQDAQGYIHVSPNGGAAGFTLTSNYLVAST